MAPHAPSSANVSSDTNRQQLQSGAFNRRRKQELAAAGFASLLGPRKRTMSSACAVGGEVDPRKKSVWNIELSDRLQRSGQSSGGTSSVKFNHKPDQDLDTTRKTTVAPNDDGTHILTILDEGAVGSDIQRYEYVGKAASQTHSYVLVFDPSTQSCTLEPLDTEYAFNLTSTPWEPSASVLASEYPQLPSPKTVSPGTATDRLNDDSPDPSNPFDFRHFLSATPSSPPPTNPAPEPAPNKERTGQNAAKPTKKSAPRPAMQKREPAAVPAPPKIHLDRRASTRPAPPAESPSLSPPASTSGLTPQPHPSHDAPISLRSAANSVSPGSRLHTPAHLGGFAGAPGSLAGRKDKDLEVIDFGELSRGGEDEDEEEDGGYEEDLSEEGESEALAGDRELEPFESKQKAADEENADEVVEENVASQEQDEDMDDEFAELMEKAWDEVPDATQTPAPAVPSVEEDSESEVSEEE